MKKFSPLETDMIEIWILLITHSFYIFSSLPVVIPLQLGSIGNPTATEGKVIFLLPFTFC